MTQAKKTVGRRPKADDLNSRVGRIHERPFAAFTIYMDVLRVYGILGAFVLGYIDYLSSTDPAHHKGKDAKGQQLLYFALPLVPMAEEFTQFLRAKIGRRRIQVRLLRLCDAGILARVKAGKEVDASDNTWYYAIDYLALEAWVGDEGDRHLREMQVAESATFEEDDDA